MRVLVTGANGYIGQGIVRRLIDNEIEVVAVDLNCENVDERAIRISGDFFKEKNPYETYGCPDILLHLAWRDGFSHASMNHMIDLPKHYQFIEKLILGGTKQICIMGSMHEVGFFEGCIDENTPCRPQSLYGIAKNALRQSVELLSKAHDICFQWIRGYYIVGNTEYGCSIFSKLTQAEKRGDSYFPFTMGTNQYDFIDYDEFCMQVVAVITQKKINGIINCCSGKPMRLGERVEQFLRDNKYNIKLKYGAFPDRPYDSKAVWGCDKKIREILVEKE